MECGFAGNPDIFGIGIRIGYYTQALAVWFANYFHFREAQNLRSVNNLFLVALAIVGLIFVHDAPEDYAVEAFLLLFIGITIASISMVDSTRFTSRYMAISNERIIANIIILFMGFAFLVWFSWTGLDILQPTPCQKANKQPSNLASDAELARQGTYSSWVVPVHMYGWFRTTLRVFSLILLTRSVLVINSSDPLILLHSTLTKKTKAAFIEAASSWNRGAEAPRHPITAEGTTTRHVDNDFPDDEIEPGPARATTTIPNDLVAPSSSFSRVYEAEVYLDSIFSLCQTQRALLGRRRLVILCNGYVRFYLPCRKATHNPNLVPLRQYFYTVFIWYGCHRVSPHVRWRLRIHLSGINKGPFLIWPHLMYRALQLSKDNKPPDWRMVATASDVQLSQIPLEKSTQVWAFAALKSLLVIIYFITQVELMIVWNHITGLNRLTSLGQLIPFILGVGGLVKILWSKWRLIKEGIQEDSRLLPPTDYEVAMATYLEWKRIHKMGLPPALTGEEQ